MAKYRRSASSVRGSVTAFGSGRAVRDAFESLSRSMNVLGQRTGVGGAWRDRDDKSASLRQRAIHLACQDVKVSLMTCCGMAALYGLSAVAMGVATGVQASPDMAGGKLEPNSATFLATLKEHNIDSSTSFLPTPPVSLLVDQKLVENSSWTSDGDRVKESYADQELFGVLCSVNESNGLTLYGAEIRVKLESPSSIPTRTGLVLTKFVVDGDEYSTYQNRTNEGDVEPPAKRTKTEANFHKGNDDDCVTQDLMEEVERFAGILSETLAMDEPAATTTTDVALAAAVSPVS
eukprot:CAMPEP_0178776172 /NCGR_PEP_ID=MMETSP0744-20121128/24583_1 /TAXON_ID=913974 /ORGANISM="Nitzschia punctata, Strain CCMP561" /LENGTH=290 /DNA_ID=CAMNT_0020433197 /DNA_START=71 /DNA_END=943 /DNA_ORIENTATION=+